MNFCRESVPLKQFLVVLEELDLPWVFCVALAASGTLLKEDVGLHCQVCSDVKTEFCFANGIEGRSAEEFVQMGELKRTTKENKKTPWPGISEEKYMTGQNQVCWLAPPTSELHTVNNLNTHTHYFLAQAPNWSLFPHERQNKPVQVHPECSEQWQLSRDKQADIRTVCIFVSNWLHDVAKYICFLFFFTTFSFKLRPSKHNRFSRLCYG